MDDTIATRGDIAGDAGSSLQPSNGHGRTDSNVGRTPNEVRLPPFGWRRPSRSWTPGIWGDPF